jgi:hypothetical protein
VDRRTKRIPEELPRVVVVLLFTELAVRAGEFRQRRRWGAQS